MHALKVALLVVLTLALMRVISWALAWPLMRWCPGQTGAVMVAANAGGLLVFWGFLHWNHLPGEFLDYSAAIFGLVVYSLFSGIDLKWHPWTKGRS